MLAAVTVVPPAAKPAPAQASPRPNVLIFMTDDQRDEDLGVMAETMAWFESGGTHFPNGFATTPLCCPSRASFMTGRYPHNHGVLANGQVGNLVQQSTIQRQLQSAGYTTAFVGKYLQGWSITSALPFFDRFSFHRERKYNDVEFNTDGVVAVKPGYITTVETATALQFLKDFEADDTKPWIMFVTPIAPHSPTTPDATYTWAPVPAWVKKPNQPEVDRSDKPPYVQSSAANLTAVERTRAAQLRTLMSVDDMVDDVMTELEVLGESNTVAFYFSDHGGLWGDHGLTGKQAPYEGSIQLPMYMRWPGHVTAGGTDSRLAGNIDLAPTVYEATGVTPDPAYPLDGRSLLQPDARGRLFFEHVAVGSSIVPTWRGIRTATYKYVEYYPTKTSTQPDFREYYDLTSDPYELVNLLGDADVTNNPDFVALSAQLNADYGCSGTTCP